MKRLAILFLIIASYLFVFGGPYGDVSSGRFVIGLSALGLICGLNMVNALMTPRRGDTAKIFLFWNVVLKLCFVPLYAVCCHLLVVREFLMASVTLLVLLGGLILVLTTSSYGWRGLWLAESEGIFSREQALFHAVLHMLYFVDVLSAFHCYWRVAFAEKNHK